jgi:ANTAR domain-containing protein
LSQFRRHFRCSHADHRRPTIHGFRLIALHGCEPGEAFARLVDESQRRNIKVRDVAVELLARLKSSL